MTPEHWLNIATYGLAPQSAQRVRAEYLAHLEDALDAGESVAEVLAEWGDPHRANAELEKAHLTTREARYLPAGYALSLRGLREALWEDVSIFVLWLIMLLPLEGSGEGSGIFSVLGLSLLATFLRWLTLSRPFSPYARAWFHWLLQPMTIAVFYVLPGGWERLKPESPMTTFVLGFAAVYLLSYLMRLFMALSAARKAEALA